MRKALLLLLPLAFLPLGFLIFAFVFFQTARHTTVAAQENEHVSVPPSPTSTIETTPTVTESEVSDATPEATVTSQPTAKIKKSSKEKMSDDADAPKSGVEGALAKKYGAKVGFVINASDENYAQGILKGGQNKWWLAAKVSDDTWTIVTDGYSYVSCSAIAKYNFPTSMVPVCWGSNTLINR